MSEKSKRQKKKHELHKADAQNKKDVAAIKQELEENPLPDFELQVGDDDTNEILNGDVQVRWCITEDLIEVLNASNVKDPHILIVSTQTKSRVEMSRQLLPVTQLKTFVRCTKAGAVNIHAWIIDGSAGRKEIRRKFMRKVDGSYNTDMLDYSGDNYNCSGAEVAKYTVAPVVIPAGVFGKEPGPRMKKFVNYWHSSKVVDECNYRQRKIIAFTVKWEAMLVVAFMSLILRLVGAGVLVATGFRKNVEWSHIPKLWYWNIDQCFSSNYNNWWDNDYIPSMKQKDANGYDINRRFVSLLPLMPAIVLLSFGITTLTCDSWLFADTIINTCKLLLALTTTTVIVDILVTLLIWSLNTSLWGWFSKQLDKIHKLLLARDGLGMKVLNGIVLIFAVLIGGALIYAFWAKLQWAFAALGILLAAGGFLMALMVVFYKLFTIDEAHNNINDVRELLCNDCDTAVKLGEARVQPFPSRQRRIKLLYLETKNKICKPMQQ